MDLAQLRTLVTVAELGSLTKASERLHVAQSALSRQVNLLEADVGAPVFQRHGRGMVATEIGEEVLVRAGRVLAEVESLRAYFRTNMSLTGRLAIACPPTVGELISVPLIERIQRSHPRLDIKILTSLNSGLIEMLQRGDAHVAVHYELPIDTPLQSYELLLESLYLVAPPGSGLSLTRAVPFSRLANENMILPIPTYGLRRIIDQCARSAGVDLKIVAEEDTYGGIKHLVRNGKGLTILPLASVQDALAAHDLTAAPLIDPTPTRRLLLYMPDGRRETPLGAFIAEAIMNITAELVAAGRWPGQLIDRLGASRSR